MPIHQLVPRNGSSIIDLEFQEASAQTVLPAYFKHSTLTSFCVGNSTCTTSINVKLQTLSKFTITNCPKEASDTS